ncbi:MAG: GNAT family N-acetyltransferase [Kofleriaceae bacterium]
MNLEGIPTLRTERLILRGPRRDDLGDSVALWGDPEVTRFLGGVPSTAEETWSRFLRNLGHWALQGFGYWVVRERDGDRFVGEVGLADLHRAIEPSLEGVPEAGWVLAPASAGRGLATEAVRAVLAWSEAALGAARVVCIINDDHVASRRVAEKCGFVRFAESRYKGAAVQMFERLAPAR